MSDPDPTPEAIEDQLERILDSEGFASSARLKQFLRHLVEEALAGRGNRLKGYTLGLEVFERDESFDPSTDTIVRVEAGRLRQRLEKYYLTTGRNDPVHIEVPRGAYVPEFRAHAAEPPALSQGKTTTSVKRITAKTRKTAPADDSQDPVFPGGPVPLGSSYYLEHPTLTATACSELDKPGSLLRIKAPNNMGKSSFLLRLLAHAEDSGFYSASLDFQQTDNALFTDLDKLLRWLCANISRQLGVTAQIDEYWSTDIGSKISCTVYLQEYLLPQLDAPLVLTFNEVNRVFDHPDTVQEFLPLLRSWYEEAKQDEALQKLRLVLVYSTEAYVPIKLNQSPFNVGLPLELLPFNAEQIVHLAQRYGLDWGASSAAEKQAELLMDTINGHPYLTQLALYHLAQRPKTKRQDGALAQLLQEAPTAAGIYGPHLQSHLVQLKNNPDLAAAFKQVISNNAGERLDPILAYRLESSGLVRLQGDRAVPRCALYRAYFNAQDL